MERVDDIVQSVEDGVLTLTIDRPERGNALAPEQRNRLVAWLDEAGGNAEVRVVVLTATGERHFCTGGDLRDSRAAPPDAGDRSRAVGDLMRLLDRGMHRLMNAVLRCEKPVIAAVNGTAAGVGCHLALCCDLIVAADDARFIEIFARRGLVADGLGAYLLPRLVGAHKAKELLFFADPLPASEAAQIGLINKAVPRAEFAEFVERWARRLADAPTVALSLTKAMVNNSLLTDRDRAQREEAMAVELNSHTADFQEGLRAFLERRDANFRGR